MTIYSSLFVFVFISSSFFFQGTEALRPYFPIVSPQVVPNNNKNDNKKILSSFDFINNVTSFSADGFFTFGISYPIHMVRYPNPAQIYVDIQNNRWSLDTGAGGITWFLRNATYATIFNQDSNAWSCGIMKATWTDQMNIFKSMTNRGTRLVIDSNDPYHPRNVTTYFGLISYHNQYKTTSSAMEYEVTEKKTISRILADVPLFVDLNDGNGPSHTIVPQFYEFNSNVVLGTPDESHFQLHSSCLSNPLDWCQTFTNSSLFALFPMCDFEKFGIINI